MGRYSPGYSYQHRIQRLGRDDFRLSWLVDRYYSGSRLRFPTRTTRDTDRAGAERFAAKWDVAMPEEPLLAAAVRCDSDVRFVRQGKRYVGQCLNRTRHPSRLCWRHRDVESDT